MSGKTARLEYAAAMQEYVAGAGESALRRAYEAGRHALAEGVGVLEMAAAHQEAMLGAMRQSSDAQESSRALARAMSCFAESLSPYEMVLRGAQEMQARLRHSEQELRRAEEELRVLKRKLTIAQDGTVIEPRNGRPKYETLPEHDGCLLQAELLAEVSARLLDQSDAESALAQAMSLALPHLGDWCFLNLAESDGHFRQAEIACVPEADAELRERLTPYCLFRRQSDSFLESLEAILEVTPQWCEQAAQDTTHLRLLLPFCNSTAMSVPLRIQDKLAGVLLFLSPRGARHGHAQLNLALELGRRCALSLATSIRFRQVTAEHEKAEKAGRAKDEFLAILSHELRNPLMPLVGWTRMLRNRSLITNDPLLAEGLRSMERNAHTLERLVGDCLDLARISEGAIRMERQPVDLNQIMAASIDSVKEMAAAKSLALSAEILQDSVLLLGDSIRLEQVIVNLLVNAVKYTDRGGSITVRCRRIQDDAEIEVKDTGAGIHPAFLEQIFEPFRRGSNSWLTNRSGLGLGLAIARTIVEMHGGRIWAESAGIDAGSTFHVKLPLAAAAIAESARELATTRDSDTAPGKRILIIEDSEDILFLLKIELEMAGHTVTTASDGTAGLALAVSRRPELIISDIRMPGFDGFELIRHIRAYDELALTPAIALTGLGGKADFDRAIAAGFDACVSKPAEPREISALIRKLTERKRTAN